MHKNICPKNMDVGDSKNANKYTKHKYMNLTHSEENIYFGNKH